MTKFVPWLDNFGWPLTANLWLFFSSLIFVFFLQNRKHKDSPGRLPVPQKEEVWHTIGVDLLGPLSETQRGNKYIVAASCLFSKWPEATPLKERSSEGVAEFLFQCFTRHGCCCIKISEEDSEFVEEVGTGFMAKWSTQGSEINTGSQALCHLIIASGQYKTYDPNPAVLCF